MRRAGLIAGMVLLFGVCIAGNARAQGAFKLGGGIHFDDDLPGVSAAIDIPFGEGGFAVSPFGDFHLKSGERVAAVGANLMFIRQMADKARLYVGGGGGFGYVRSERNERDFVADSVTNEVIVAKKTQAMADAVLGIEYQTTARASMFVQVKYIGMYGGGGTEVDLPNGNVTTADLDVKALAAHIGLAIHFGERSGGFDY